VTESSCTLSLFLLLKTITLSKILSHQYRSRVSQVEVEREMGSDENSAASSRANSSERIKKQGLGWIEWGRGWCKIVEEFLFQRIMASHLENPMSLPPLDGVTCIVTGATSGIGLETARSGLCRLGVCRNSSKNNCCFK